MTPQSKVLVIAIVWIAFGGLALFGLSEAAPPAPGEDGSVVDGWPVGAVFHCPVNPPTMPPHQIDRPCDALLTSARYALDKGDRTHPSVVTAELHRYRPFQPRVPDIAVFRLADGSVRAIAVGYRGIETTTTTWDYPPCGMPALTQCVMDRPVVLPDPTRGPNDHP